VQTGPQLRSRTSASSSEAACGRDGRVKAVPAASTAASNLTAPPAGRRRHRTQVPLAIQGTGRFPLRLPEGGALDRLAGSRSASYATTPDRQPGAGRAGAVNTGTVKSGSNAVEQKCGRYPQCWIAKAASPNTTWPFFLPRTSRRPCNRGLQRLAKTYLKKTGFSLRQVPKVGFAMNQTQRAGSAAFDIREFTH